MNNVNGKIGFSVELDNTQLQRDVRKAKQEFSGLSDQVVSECDRIDGTFSKIGKTVGSLATAWSFQEFARQVASVRGEFQQLEVAMETMLGSKAKAEALMAQMVRTAATTPFGLQEVAGGAKQLLAYGMASEKVNENLIRLGNIASGLSIPLNDIIYLYGTTMTQGRLYAQDMNQFTGRGIPMVRELAKQFGVTEDKVKEMVSAGKVGFPEVEKVIQSLTNEGGMFFNLMEKQSHTITGQISNIEDAFDSMLNDIGKSNEGIINDALGATSTLVENYEKVGQVIGEVIAAYGVYKAAVITLSAVENMRYQATLAQMAGMTKMQAVTEVLTLKTKALHELMIKNPYTLAAVAVTALVAAMYKLATYQTDYEQKLEKLNDLVSEFNKMSVSEQRELAKLKGELSGLEKGTDAYKQVKDKIVKGFGQYYDGLDAEIEKVGLTEQAYNKLTEAITRSFGARQYDKFKKEQEGEIDSVMSENLETIQKRLNEALGDQFGSSAFVKIRDAIFQGRITEGKNKLGQGILEGLDVWSQHAIEKSKIGKWGFKDGTVEQAIRRILRLQKETAELDRLARQRFGIKDEAVSEKTKDDGHKPTTYLEDVQKAKEDWFKAKKVYEDIIKDQKATSKQVVDARLDMREKEKSYRELSGHNASEDKVAAKHLKEQERLNSELLKLKEETEDKAISLMKDGTEKRIKEIDSRYDKELAAVRKMEKDLRDSQGGKLSQQQQEYIDSIIKVLNAGKAQEISKVMRDRMTEQKRAMNDYLKEYGSFYEKKEAIASEYNERIRKALDSGNMGEALSLNAERNRLISSLDSDADYLVSSVEKAFGDISNLSSAAIDTLIDNLEKYKKEAINTFDVKNIDKYEETLNKLKDAKIDNNFGLLKNLIPDSVREQLKLQEEINEAEKTSNELTLKKLQLSADIVQKEKDILAEIKKQTGVDIKKDDLYSAGGLEGVYNLYKSSGKDASGVKKQVAELVNLKTNANEVGAASDKAQKKLFGLFNTKGGGGGAASTVATIDAIVNGINDIVHGVSDAMDEIKATKEALGKDTDIDTRIGKLSAGMKMFSEASQGATDAWNSLKKGDMGGVFAGVTKSFTGWIKGFAAIHDAKHEKVIERIQERVETLTKSYDRLGDSIEKAYSHDAKDLIEDQNKLLEQQKVLIQQQILEEEKKKKTNHKRVDEWKEQIEDIDKLISENKEKAVDAIFGEDVKSAIDDFASAYSEAWTNGEDRVKSAKDTVKDMMRQMVTESIKAAIQTSGRMEDIRNMLVSFYDDEVLSEWEQGYIYDMAERLEGYLSDKFGWADSLMKDEKEEKEDKAIKGLEALQKAYDKLSDSVSKVYSSDRVRVIQEQNMNLAEQKRLLEERIAIEKDEESLKGYKKQLEDINAQLEANKEAAKDAIFGSDVQSAIGEFVSAYTNALGTGDTSNVAEDFVQNMVRSMVIEAMKADASPAVDIIRTKLIDAWKDGVVSSEEQAAVKDLVDQLNKEFGDKYDWANNLFYKPTTEVAGLEDLEKAYSDLSDAVSKAYSTDRVKLIEQQISLLEKQKSLLEDKISGTDDLSLIKTWNEQLDDVKEQIDASRDAQIDAIFGSDTQSAINSFANALIDAWAKGEDKAKSVKDVTKSIIRGMVTESVKADLAPMTEDLRKQLKEMYSDGSISDAEKEVVDGIVSNMTEILEKQYAWADQFFKQEEEVKETVEEVKDTFSGLTFESTRDEFTSLLSDMNTDYASMCESMEDKLKQSILKGFLDSRYKEQIQKLLSTWDMYGDSGNIDENEIQLLREQYKTLLDSMIKDRDDLADKFGWQKFQQEGSRGMSSSMSEETGSELNGRVTAVQMDVSATRINSEEIRNLQMTAVDHLEDISRNTHQLYEMNSRLEKIEKNTRGL